MTANAGARTWWAAYLRRARSPAQAGSLDTAAARVSSLTVIVLAIAILACAAVGLATTQREDVQAAAARHTALEHALDDLHATFGDVDRLDDAQLRFMQSRSGLADLRFDADAIGNRGREVQSLHDAQGRIVGWFSWSPRRAFIVEIDQLWALVGLIVLVLALGSLCFAVFVGRLSRSLARRTEAVRKLTNEDALTGLPNHAAMLIKLAEALERRCYDFIALVRIDLDGFREVNDTLGRAGGDAVVAEIAKELKTSLPAGGELGRFEDDEFAVIMSSNNAGAAAALADTLRAAFARRILGQQLLQISAGIGVAQAPEDGATAEELSRRAGLALRVAKRGGRAMVRHFEPQLEMQDSERRFLRRELESAIQAQALYVHYQPVVAAAGGGIVGVEALARWSHPARGAIAPSVFIPLAEQCGLMRELGTLVLRRALADARRWPSLSVAVNLSPMQIRDRNLVDLVEGVIAESRVEASRIVLEVTEGVLIDDPTETLARLEALRALGVGIALDDFGTGYSSLSYLQKFPFSQLKIDRAFVASLGASGHAGAIIQSIVTLGHALGMHVLAEGVETDEQRVLLRLAGCDEMQGFLFAAPQPAQAIDIMVSRSAAERDAKPRMAASAR